MGSRSFVVFSAIIFSLFTTAPTAQQAAKGGVNSIQQDSLKEWLTYIASDELQGRATYSEGLGLAAGYISAHLAQWGVKPVGDDGTYLQVVKVLGVRSTSHASVTVEVNGQSRTFNDGAGHHVSQEHGRQADHRRRRHPVRGLRPDAAVGGPRRLRQGQSKGEGRRVAGIRGAEDVRVRALPRAERNGAQSLRARQGCHRDDRSHGSNRGRPRPRRRCSGDHCACHDGHSWSPGAARAGSRCGPWPWRRS